MSATRYSETVVGHGRLSNNSFEVLVLNDFISLLEGFDLATVFYCRLGCEWIHSNIHVDNKKQ